MKWIEIKEVTMPSLEKEDVLLENEYKLLGIRLWGKGCYSRDVIKGVGTQYKYFTVAQVGDLLFNKIWARNGAISVITDEFNGYYISPEFPVYHINKDELLPRWLYYYSQYHQFWNDCEKSSRGTSGKNRIKPSQFERIKIPIPSLPEQKRIVKKLDTIQNKINQIKALRAAQEQELKNLLYSRFVETIVNVSYQKMEKVAPIIRRPVEVKLTEEYPELGIRSFGKGTFQKPALKGIDVGTKKLYTIKANDLLFSNVFAWEGAIAVVQAKDDGRVGSHRFISCLCDEKQVFSEFLGYYFLSEEGLEKVRLASPGGAGRNKTLGLKKLEKIEVPTPSIDKQLEFIAFRKKIRKSLQELEDNQSQLEELMPSLLDKAFKGEL